VTANIVSFFTDITPQNLETLAAKRCDTIKLKQSPANAGLCLS
jgi:hypothetical protein